MARKSVRRCSPVTVGKSFKPRTSRYRSFVNMGFQAGNKGIQHTLFLNRAGPEELVVSEEITQVTGLCSYCYLYAPGSTTVHGILFLTPRSKTLSSSYKVTVCSSELTPDSFDPFFDLEKLGVLYYVATDGSVLLLVADLDSRLLVKAH